MGKGNYSIGFYLDDKIIYFGASTEFMKAHPGWNRKLGVGQRINISGTQRTINKLEIIRPESPGKTTVIKCKLK